jgi:N-acetylmuramoyl-L-alanine amidase
MPSCLIELGFITTPEEERFLNSGDGIDRLGYGIYKAFLDYKRKYDGRITVPYQAEQTQPVNVPSVVPPKEEKEELAETTTPVVTQNEPAKTTVPATPQKETAVTAEPVEVTKENTNVQDASLIFKVQILASASPKKISKKQLNGQPAAKYYEEGGFYKYTVGESTDYDEIVQVRESLVKNFPEAFVIAFKGGQKVDIRAAIREYRAKKK